MKPWVMLVGQAPSRTSDPKLPLSGRTGRTLARWCGLTDAEFRERFLLTNAADRWPGPAPGGGDLVPWGGRYRGRLRALLDHAGMAEVRVVLLGDAVRRLVLGSSTLPPYRWVELPELSNVRVCWAPHPSGVSRLWNTPREVSRARAFFRRLAR